MSKHPSIDELTALGERALLIREGAGMAGAHELVLVAANDVYVAVNKLAMIMARDYGTKLPEGVTIVKAPFSRDELRDWIDRIRLTLTEKRDPISARTAWWQELGRALEFLDSLTYIQELAGPASPIETPKLELVREAGRA